MAIQELVSSGVLSEQVMEQAKEALELHVSAPSTAPDETVILLTLSLHPYYPIYWLVPHHPCLTLPLSNRPKNRCLTAGFCETLSGCCPLSLLLSPLSAALPTLLSLPPLPLSLSCPPVASVAVPQRTDTATRRWCHQVVAQISKQQETVEAINLKTAQR